MNVRAISVVGGFCLPWRVSVAQRFEGTHYGALAAEALANDGP